MPQVNDNGQTAEEWARELYEKERLPVVARGYQKKLDGSSVLLVNDLAGSTQAYDPDKHAITRIDRVKMGCTACTFKHGGCRDCIEDVS